MSYINSTDYWDKRFGSGNWDGRARVQTQEYAKANIEMINLGPGFTGTILDFGCALGDAIPLYAKAFPEAKLRGIDVSNRAIELCVRKFGTIANFVCGTAEDVPFTDIIIASHVMEHIDNDKKVVRTLLQRCKELFVIVPYKEEPLYFEHVNYYNETYYEDMKVDNFKIFSVTYKKQLSIREVVKGLLFLKLQFYSDFEKKMIMFHFKNSSNIPLGN